MNHRFQKLTSGVLSLLLVFLLMSFTACGQSETPATTELIPAPRLNNIALSDFSIVYAEDSYGYNLRAAEYIQSEIQNRTGLNLSVVKDSDPAAGTYEIVIGDTSREISSRLEPVSDSVQFAILAEDTQVALEGEYFVIAAAAYYFIQTYVPENNFSAVIPREVSIHDPIVEAPDNYILLIGDGMGVNQTLLFDAVTNNCIYGHGEDTFFGYYLPYSGLSRTASLSGVTDSAAGGTALACGIKTINYYIGQDQNHNPVQSLTELAASRGMATAVMSTEKRTGATPASFSAHADDRTLNADILVSQNALMQEYGTIIDCDYDKYRPKGITTLCDSVANTLQTLHEDPDGFFMMYEEAHIDKHSHNNDVTATFNAAVRFNRVIALVMEWAFYHPNTMVVITADHETGGLTPDAGTFVYTTTEHTIADVPVFVYGVGGEVFHNKTFENIQIPQTIASFMGVDDFGDQSEVQPLTKQGNP